MRELKFRAWDDNRKEMLSDIINSLGSPDWRIGKTFMQYTGLLDKNGIEIYEGDVVDIEWDGREPFGEGGERAIIKWANGGFELTFYTKYGGEGYGLLNDKTQKYWEKIKVIGDIYENPELLGEE